MARERRRAAEQPRGMWGFLQPGWDFIGEVLDAVKTDRKLAAVWGFAILFVEALILILGLAKLTEFAQFGVILLIIGALCFLLVYTVRRLPANGYAGRDKSA